MIFRFKAGRVGVPKRTVMPDGEGPAFGQEDRRRGVALIALHLPQTELVRVGRARPSGRVTFG